MLIFIKQFSDIILASKQLHVPLAEKYKTGHNYSITIPTVYVVISGNRVVGRSSVEYPSMEILVDVYSSKYHHLCYAEIIYSSQKWKWIKKVDKTCPKT